MLVLGVGSGTKALGNYLSGDKAYYAVAQLGFETDTLDCLGQETKSSKFDHVSSELLKSKINKFKGNVSQVPPMYSAKKRDGTRLYDLARRGIVVEREPVTVFVSELELSEPFNAFPLFGLNISCGGGFYVRSLIEDLGRECESAAHMTSLIRTKQGQFSISDTLRQHDWNFESIMNCMHRHSSIIGYWPSGDVPNRNSFLVPRDVSAVEQCRESPGEQRKSSPIGSIPNHSLAS